MRKLPAVLLITFITASTALAQTADELEVRNLIAGSDRAKLYADLTFFERAYSDDYSYTSARGEVDGKKAALEWYRKYLKEGLTFRLSSMKSDAQLVRVVGNMAVVTGTWAATVEGTEKNPHPPYVNRGRFTTVLEKRGGRWLIVAEHDSEAPRDRKLAEQEVLRAGREYNELMKRLKGGRSYAELEKSGDIAALSRTLADEYVYTSRDGEVSGKAEDLESYKTMQIKIASADLLDQKVRMIGDRAAVEIGTIRYKGINKGESFDITKRYTTTWVWRGGRWQIVADHTSKVNQ